MDELRFAREGEGRGNNTEVTSDCVGGMVIFCRTPPHKFALLEHGELGNSGSGPNLLASELCDQLDRAKSRLSRRLILDVVLIVEVECGHQLHGVRRTA